MAGKPRKCIRAFVRITRPVRKIIRAAKGRRRAQMRLKRGCDSPGSARQWSLYMLMMNLHRLSCRTHTSAGTFLRGAGQHSNSLYRLFAIAGSSPFDRKSSRDEQSHHFQRLNNRLAGMMQGRPLREVSILPWERTPV